MTPEQADRWRRGIGTVRTLGLTAARRAQVRLEGRLPQLSAARRNLPEREELPYASHLPILLGLQRLRPMRAVLELGAGDFSTGTFLDRTCFPVLERLTSIEVDSSWRAKMEADLGGDARLELLGDGHPTTGRVIAGLDLEAYDVIFVDDSARAADRSASIAVVVAAAPRHPLVVVHDFEVPDYRRATAPLDHVHIFSCFNPMTGVCWNGGGMRTTALSYLAKRIQSESSRLAINDRRGWNASLESLEAYVPHVG